jgi:hypothetical protein
VNTVGPIRQVVEVSSPETRRYLVIAPGSPEQLGQAVQLQIAELLRNPITGVAGCCAAIAVT